MRYAGYVAPIEIIKMHTIFSLGDLKGRDFFAGIAVDERINLEWVNKGEGGLD